MKFVTVQGHRLEYQIHHGTEPEAPMLVFLHEGLGSVALWKDFPQRVVAATGCSALVYSRYGYGHSDPITEPRKTDYMHREALEVLPELLDKLEIRRPLLFGHSDGASIALIHAGGAGRELAGLIVMAPHVMVEDISVRSIEAAKEAYATTDMRQKLARHQADPDGAFKSWNDIWLHPDFRRWNIEEYLPRIRVPILAIQGHDDEYGTMVQIERIAAAAPDVELLKLEDCRHSPHRDQPEMVIAAVQEFIRRVADY